MNTNGGLPVGRCSTGGGSTTAGAKKPVSKRPPPNQTDTNVLTHAPTHASTHPPANQSIHPPTRPQCTTTAIQQYVQQLTSGFTPSSERCSTSGHLFLGNTATKPDTKQSPTHPPPTTQRPTHYGRYSIRPGRQGAVCWWCRCIVLGESHCFNRARHFGKRASRHPGGATFHTPRLPREAATLRV